MCKLLSNSLEKSIHPFTPTERHSPLPSLFRPLNFILLSWILLACTPQSTRLITTVAGQGASGFAGDGEAATQAHFNEIRGIALDVQNNLYIADVLNHRVRKVDARTGLITTVAGTGTPGFKGDGGLAIEAQLNEPVGVVTDQAGHLYIVDMLNYRVRKVDAQGLISTFAGTGQAGFSGDGGPAIQARIHPTYGDLAMDESGNVYLADRDNHRIRKIDQQGLITTVVGNGIIGDQGDGGLATQAQLNSPEDMVLDQRGNLYIADSYNHLIRKVNPQGIIMTLAGRGTSGLGDGGMATLAQFHLPIGIAIDHQDNLYIADAENHRIRKIDTQGFITTVLGTEVQGYSPDGEEISHARLHFPEDVVVDQEDNLYVTDKDNFRVRRVIEVKRPAEFNWVLGLLWVLGGLLFLLGIGQAIHYLRFYRHPLVVKLSADPSQLLTLPLEQLPKVKHLLTRTHRLETVLASLDILPVWLDEAIEFISASNETRNQRLAKRFQAVSHATVQENIFLWRLDPNFPLNLSRCLVYFPGGDLSVNDILQPLKQDETRLQVTLVITLNFAQQMALRPHGENLATLWVVPDHRELTTLLLSAQATQALVHLLGTQLKITHISPYQTRGGITKEILFFGREKILAHMLNREPANYLILGGRQLGKSSLLKQIERCYRNHPQVDCRYLVLRDHHLQPRLTAALNLPKDAFLSTLLENLSTPQKKNRLFLIDETDRFIQEEMAQGYPLLNHLRGISEEGHCHFILAGAWALYRAAVLDYHSPLVNFGQHFIIGALEPEACRQLATQPLAMLDIHYESAVLIEQILTATGRRANLIAIVCHELLDQLGSHQRFLNQEAVFQALSSDAVREALMGWTHLTGDEQATRLDRMIVYSTVEKERFDLSQIMNLLNEQHYEYTQEQLEEALARLELAFILCYEDKYYRYSVPLFQDILRKG